MNDDLKVLVKKPALRKTGDEVVVPTPIEPEQLFTQKKEEDTQ